MRQQLLFYIHIKNRVPPKQTNCWIILDVDECTVPSHDCHMNADCNNTVGNFNCTCKSGFTGDGKNCEGKKK